MENISIPALKKSYCHEWVKVKADLVKFVLATKDNINCFNFNTENSPYRPGKHRKTLKKLKIIIL